MALFAWPLPPRRPRSFRTDETVIGPPYTLEPWLDFRRWCRLEKSCRDRRTDCPVESGWRGRWRGDLPGGVHDLAQRGCAAAHEALYNLTNGVNTAVMLCVPTASVLVMYCADPPPSHGCREDRATPSRQTV